MTDECNVGEIAGEVMELIMSKTNKLKEGKEFTDACLDILTLCISELIKAGYCNLHYGDALDKATKQIKEDLSIDD